MEKLCEATIRNSSGWRGLPCIRKMKVMRDGVCYCTIHDPVYRAKKQQEALDRFRGKVKAVSLEEDERIERQELSVKYCEHVSLDQLREWVENG